MIGRNPADAVEAPRKRSTEMQTLDVPSIGRLLEAAEGTQQYVPVLLAVTTGMRRGEIFALKWDNVDLRSGKLFVRHSLEKSKDGLRFKEPKTPRAKRCIALPAFVVEALKRHKRLLAQHRLAIGPAYCDLGIVCPREDGKPRHPDTFSTAFCVLRAKVGLPTLRFHDLRHTHASQLLAEGVHPKVVSERLGHSTINLTLDTYSHVMPGMQEDAARKIDQALRHAVETSKPLTKSS
jgi:integrase